MHTRCDVPHRRQVRQYQNKGVRKLQQAMLPVQLQATHSPSTVLRSAPILSHKRYSLAETALGLAAAAALQAGHT
jgi:hypothetical protein